MTSDQRPGTETPPVPASDIWSDWILHHRSGRDPAHERIVRASMERFADRALDGADLAPGMTVADVGAGDGLIAFRAIDRIGPSLKVVLTDISPALLAHAETLARQLGVRDQCTFVHCPADRLAPLQDASVDALITRAVLAYVADKPAALREFHRVLKPGGRLSMAEPVFRDDAFEVVAMKNRIETAASSDSSHDRLLRLMYRWKLGHFPDTLEQMAETPITSYTERDLFRFVVGAGFAETHLELHLDAVTHEARTWETFLDVAPHPAAIPLRRILAEQFTPEERAFFEQSLRPLVETQRLTTINRMVYITANKPTADAGSRA